MYLPLMEESHPEFNTCEHTTLLTNLCTECDIFVCEECSMDHIVHLEKLNAWDSVIKEYLLECKNYQSRLHLLIKNNMSVQNIKNIVSSKVDEKYRKLIERLNKYKAQIFDELWEEYSKTDLVVQAASLGLNESLLKKLLEKLNNIMDEIKLHEETEDKESTLLALKKGVLRYVRKKFEEFEISNTPGGLGRTIKKHSMTTGTNIDIQLQDFMDYDKFKGIWFYNSTQLIGEVTESYTFPDGSRKWRKNNKIRAWVSQSCETALPHYFLARFRINKFTHHCFGVFGVAKRHFVHEGGNYITWEGDQWGCSENGFFYSYGRDKRVVEENDSVVGNNGDMITLVYDQSRTLYFEYNGIRQNLDFPRLDGPFYLCASLLSDGSEIEIMEVRRTA